MSISATSNTVLKSFIAGANAQYRDAGLSQYQMRLQKDGTVTVPGRPAPKFQPAAASGSAAAEQAVEGAAPGAAAPGAAGPKRTGPAPVVVDLAQGGADSFKMTWKPVAGARQYGIWQDGVLIGHVPSPSFAGQLAQGGSGVIEIDAVRADGTRTALTRALRVTRTAQDKITFDVPGATGPATAPAPAAQQGAPPATPAPAPSTPAPAPAPAATAPAAAAS